MDRSAVVLIFVLNFIFRRIDNGRVISYRATHGVLCTLLIGTSTIASTAALPHLPLRFWRTEQGSCNDVIH